MTSVTDTARSTAVHDQDERQAQLTNGVSVIEQAETQDDDTAFDMLMPTTEALARRYPTLMKYSDPVVKPSREVIGREHEILQLMAAMSRPELCNALLLAPAGAGKTTIVQAAGVADADRTYLEVDVSRMIAGVNTADQMAAELKQLFDEAEAFSATESEQLVLFMDEFHQIVQLSAASVEALKPVLAASGTRGIRIIAATTFEEFHQHIAPNQPLVERLQRINVSSPDEPTTVKILRGMAERYGVADQFYNDSMFELIYEYTERYIPASSQPRKSILVLDSMVGWHEVTGRAMDRMLLADVLQETTNMNVAFQVDAVSIQDRLNQTVLGQQFATATMAKQLQLCVADLNDKTRPMSSFLLTGSTGVGKELDDDTFVPVFTEDGRVSKKRHGDLEVGDKVFTRDGAVQDVLGHFPQGVKDMYRFTFWDGRTIDAGAEHLWPIYTAKMRSQKHAGREVKPTIMTTRELVEKGVVWTYSHDTREHLKYFVPANGAVQWPEQHYEVDPYTVGVFIGNGCLRESALTLSSDDAAVVQRIGASLGSTPKKTSLYNYSWVFPTGERWGATADRVIQTKDVFAAVSELIGTYSRDIRIPQWYMTGAVEQRWELIRGLFDTDGTIESSSGRFNVSFSTASKGLVEDVRELLFSVGVSNTMQTHTRTAADGAVRVEYDVHVKVSNEDKEHFFWLPRKRQIAAAAAEATRGRERVKKFDMVGIKSIEKLPEQRSASCIYVSGDEHLYQAGQFVVTHNTELTKQLAQLVFGDHQDHLIRFDMSEYALEESVEAFRSEITKQVWNMGHSVILLDEVEKAASTVTRVLLQVLDDGRLSDDNGRQVSFLNSYIVLTTNAGSEIYSTIADYSPDDTGSGQELIKKMKEIRRAISSTQDNNRFPPELLGRIDQIVPFQPLSRETQRSIVQHKLSQMRREVMRKHGVLVDIEARVLQYLVDDKIDTDSDSGGARAAISRLNDEVLTSVAAFLNANPHIKDIVVAVNGVMRSEDKQLLESDAHIVVYEA